MPRPANPETRSRLLEKGGDLVSSRGFNATGVQEITAAAGVPKGSFYNYFDSKDAIVAAVVDEVVTAAGEAIAAATKDIDDPAEVVAVAHRSIVYRAAEEPDFGWLLVRLEISHDLVFAALGPYAARDLDSGIEAGRFKVDDPAVALIAAGGALLAIVRAVLQSRAKPTAAEHHAAYVLRMFGLPPDDAAEVASRPLPTGDWIHPKTASADG